MGQSPILNIRHCDDGPLVCFGAADINRAATAKQIRVEIEDVLNDADPGVGQYLTINFRETSKLTTAALNQLILLQQKARKRDVSLVLLDVQETVRNVFEMTRLEQMFRFDFSDDETDAAVDGSETRQAIRQS